MATPVSAFTKVNIPKQKVFHGVPFPLSLSPPSAPQGTTKNLADAIVKHKGWLEEILQEAGAILFRGFDIRTPLDFNEVLEAFGYNEAPVMASGAPRRHIVGKVYTANDGPSDKKFYFHNEMAYIANHPTKAFFCCLEEPESGGETPIVLGRVLYDRMANKYPEFVKHLEQTGLIYCRGLGDGNDPKSLIGRGWQDTFGTNDKTVAEHKAGELGWELVWREDGGVQAKMAPVPGVKVTTDRDGGKQKLWFNSLAAAYVTWSDGRNEEGAGVMFADGTHLPKNIMEDYLVIAEDECVAFPWKRGDLLVLDNFAVQHSRNPFTGTRRVLAAFAA